MVRVLVIVCVMETLNDMYENYVSEISWFPWIGVQKNTTFFIPTMFLWKLTGVQSMISLLLLLTSLRLRRHFFSIAFIWGKISLANETWCFTLQIRNILKWVRYWKTTTLKKRQNHVNFITQWRKRSEQSRSKKHLFTTPSFG